MASILTIISASVLAVLLYSLFQEFLSPSARRRKRPPPGPPGVPTYTKYRLAAASVLRPVSGAASDWPTAI
jgi:hypothetical protein